MIAPHFERMAKEFSSPKKAAFAKINVDNQTTIAQTYGVSAMPTFIIFHGGKAINTIKGANPQALQQAVAEAMKLGGATAAPGAGFKSPGRTLGADRPRAPLQRPLSYDLSRMFGGLVAFLGLYIISLFSVSYIGHNICCRDKTDDAAV
jgi:thioredoxin 1